LKLSLLKPALLRLQGIMASDDQEVKAWYMQGWAFYLMTEPPTNHQMGSCKARVWLGGLTKDARDCLETCRNVGGLEMFPLY